MITGAIASAARSYIPATWDGLSLAANLGDAGLQRVVDLAQFRLFGSVVANAGQSGAYNPIQVDYLGKMVAYGLIPGGIDYWGDQLLSEQIRGTEEAAVYADRRTGLYKVQARLAGELVSDLPGVTGAIIKKRAGVASTSGPGFVTQDPGLFPAIDSCFGTWPPDPFSGPR